MAESAALAVAAPHGWPEDGCCANCGTALSGHWCHACGQRAADHHRSLRHLLYEGIEGFTHVDGRLWRTLRRLAFRPADLTRDYLRGRRASEVPPLRMFFITLLVVFAVGAITNGNSHNDFSNLRADAPEIHQALGRIEIHGFPRFSAWLRTHLQRAVDDPPAFFHTMHEWAERFAFLLLPLSALSLEMLFPFRRGVKLYDHLIFTLHSLSFAGMAVALSMVLGKIPVVRVLSGFLLLALPVHLFVHMRGLYGISAAGTLLRMAALFVMTAFSFLFILAALSVVSLSLMD
jgi:hypothetical protein